MPKLKTSEDKVREIVRLRRIGHSLNEICRLTGKGNSTVFKYSKDVSVLPKYKESLRKKQGGSLERSKVNWKEAAQKAGKLMGRIVDRDKLFILACLYWGEGNKTELNLNNSDPSLIRVFIDCLEEIGVKKEDLKITLRIYDDINKEKAIKFWASFLKIPPGKIMNVNILQGKKEGKLKYGMCRVRVRKGGPYFKLIMSMIDLIKSNFNAAVVQWIEQDTPNV